MKLLSCLLVLALALCLVQARPKRFKYSQEQDSSNEDSEENDAVTKARFVKATCGYASCPVPVEGVINVHLVPHTHDDVGWLKTVDQYFYGSNTRTQSAGVQYILDSVVEALIKDPTRRFVYVETAFFWLWWEQQNDQRRHHVRRLVDEGRLEFAGGAWTMNDEATTHYQSIVDQFTWGLRKLNDTFGECGRPRVGWQIDPFGHSREQANIFSGLGFDGLLLGRDDFQDKINRMGNKQAEMIWRGSDDIGQSSDLFTGIMFNTYAPPPGFCFDVLCSDDPIIDDKRSPDYNVDAMVERFVGRFIRAQTQAYRTNNVIVTMGGDFTYMQAEMWYKNMDKLIKYTNANEPRVKLFYSTPSCYVKAVHDANIKWPTKQDDFFPYASDAHSFWTGYFSSRPTLKYFERSANNFLQASKQLYAMTNLNEKDKVDLNMLRSAMGVMQHHDAITGTEKQHVANDYARRLDEGVQDCLITTREALNDLMSRTSAKSRNKKSSRAAPYMPVTMCQLNITQCATTEGSNSFVVTLYNPLGHIVSHYTRVPVSGDSYVVRDPQGSLVPTQMVTISNGTSFQILDRNSTAGAELIFLAANLPPLGYRSYYVSSGSSRDIAIENPEDDDVQIEEDYGRSDKREVHIIERLSGVDEEDLTTKLKKAIAEEYSIGNEHLRLSVDSETGYISSIFVAQYNTTIPLTQEFLYYEGESGNNAVAANRSSGAYIFRPKPGAPKSISTKPDNRVYKGELVEELHQQFSDWATQVVRVYKGQRYAEFEWLVGPIPVDDKIGKEVISRFSSNLKSAGTFYTDSNGRQLLKRVLNFRPTWELTLEEPVAGNYYPVTSAIAVRDQDSGLEMSILTDRAQGGSSLADGQVELMVHRRLLFDDAFGVGEALDEKDGERGLVAKGRHFLHIGKNEDKGSVVRRQLILAKQLEPTAFFTQASNLTFQQWQGANNEFSGLNTELPANVHLLTVEPWKDGTILIRLEHFLSKTDDPEELSKPVTLNVQRLFSGMDIETIRETTLGGNQYLEDSDTLKWEAETFDNSVDIVPIKKQSKPLVDDKVLDQIDGIKALVEENRSIIENMQRTVEKMQKEREGLDYYPSGSASIEEVKPKVERKKKTVKKHKNTYDEQSMEITLEPMQIRTFLVTAKFLE